MQREFWFSGVLLGLACLSYGCDESEAPPAQGMLDAGDKSDGGKQGGDGDSAPDGGPDEDLPALPAGSRVFDHVVNLVDPQLADDLRVFMANETDEGGMSASDMLMPYTDFADLSRATSVFLEYYRDEYDFIVFASDEDYNPKIDGLFQRVDSPIIPGTGIDRYHHPAYAYGRLMGVIAVDVSNPEERAPLAHEVLHYWANHLDRRVGFGDAFEGGLSSHWGTTSVNGQLGGFDAASLRCAKPQGALPPACTAESNGKFHYEINLFRPVSSWEPEMFYAPLELYMMGLLPRSELPTSFVKVLDAAPEPLRYAGSDKIVVEGTGIGEVLVQDIIDMHGPRALTPENERHFTMAVVVLTAEPASDAFMRRVSSWAESFGGHASSAKWPSFHTMTGERATMETRLGPRRRPEDPALNPRANPPAMCDVLAQDCEGSLGCYEPQQPVCLPSRGGALGEPCDQPTDCAPGLDCAGFDILLCAPYCDPDSDTSPKACSALCPGAFATILETTSPSGESGLCFAGAGGGTCDPLAQACEPGFGCYGRDGTNCLPAGNLPLYASCGGFFGNLCAPGAECIGIQGGSGFYCQPYCDPAVGASGPNACMTLCTNSFWPYNEGAHAICIPES